MRTNGLVLIVLLVGYGYSATAEPIDELAAIEVCEAFLRGEWQRLANNPDLTSHILSRRGSVTKPAVVDICTAIASMGIPIAVHISITALKVGLT